MLKKIHPLSYTLIGLSILLFLPSCQDTPAPPTDRAITADSSAISNGGAIKFQGQLFSIPSPVHVAMIMQKANVQYNETLINPVANGKNYVEQMDQALNLGVYGADLAYLSNFSKPQLSQEYFSVVGTLANSLDILQNIDQNLIKRLNDNISSRDSILALTASFYKEGDRYLKNGQRQQLAAGILLGGWVEALHLSCDAALTNADIRSRIGEQKSAVKSLAAVMGDFTDEQSKKLSTDLNQLAGLFDNLASTYKYEAPITDQVSKTTFLRSKNTVNLTDGQLTAITQQVKEIRNSIIQ